MTSDRPFHSFPDEILLQVFTINARDDFDTYRTEKPLVHELKFAPKAVLALCLTCKTFLRIASPLLLYAWSTSPMSEEELGYPNVFLHIVANPGSLTQLLYLVIEFRHNFTNDRLAELAPLIADAEIGLDVGVRRALEQGYIYAWDTCVLTLATNIKSLVLEITDPLVFKNNNIQQFGYENVSIRDLANVRRNQQSPFATPFRHLKILSIEIEDTDSRWRDASRELSALLSDVFLLPALQELEISSELKIHLKLTPKSSNIKILHSHLYGDHWEMLTVMVQACQALRGLRISVPCSGHSVPIEHRRFAAAFASQFPTLKEFGITHHIRHVAASCWLRALVVSAGQLRTLSIDIPTLKVWLRADATGDTSAHEPCFKRFLPSGIETLIIIDGHHDFFAPPLQEHAVVHDLPNHCGLGKRFEKLRLVQGQKWLTHKYCIPGDCVAYVRHAKMMAVKLQKVYKTDGVKLIYD